MGRADKLTSSNKINENITLKIEKANEGAIDMIREAAYFGVQQCTHYMSDLPHNDADVPILKKMKTSFQTILDQCSQWDE